MELSVVSKEAEEVRRKFLRVRDEVAKVIVGQEALVHSLLVALLADGHVLLEGVPGLAKTLAVTTLAKAIRCDCKRIQFTPDLLPADLIGTSVYQPQQGTFTVRKGPIFTNLVLADEINRAPAKVQSALLEVMQEKQATINGETYKTGNPFLVLATQNPIELEGTYPLAEAATDRFMFKIRLDYPSRIEEKEILDRMGKLGPKPEPEAVIGGDEILAARKVVDEVYLDDKVAEYILAIVGATREEKLLEYGASPRASLCLKIAGKAEALLAGRAYVTPHDIKNIALDVLRHRIRRSFEAEAEEVTADAIILRLLQTIPMP